jgi:hypothetical protein
MYQRPASRNQATLFKPMTVLLLKDLFILTATCGDRRHHPDKQHWAGDGRRGGFLQIIQSSIESFCSATHACIREFFQHRRRDGVGIDCLTGAGNGPASI